jgi:glycogen debranching enzyme
MCCGAIGSNRGYDELVPHHIHVVNERRVYTYWNDEETAISNVKAVSRRTGIISARILFNNLHKNLQLNGYTEIFVDQVDFDTVAVTRFNPDKMKSVILVARTVFFESSYNQNSIRPLKIAGKINNILIEMKMVGKPDKYKADDFVINGVQDFRVEVRENILPEHSEFVSISKSNINQIDFKKLEPGNVIAFEVELEERNTNAMHNFERFVNQFYTTSSELKDIVAHLDLDDLNFILFRVGIEEYDECKGGPYKIPNFNDFNYCGLASLMYHWKTIRTHNDLGHPICGNLREGIWLPNYIADRLFKRESTMSLGVWLKDAFHHLDNLPHYLIPKYFDKIITPLYSLLLQQCWKSFNSFIQNGNEFIQLLALGTIALVGYNRTAPLPPLSNKINLPKPNYTMIDNVPFPTCPTIAAGLPHFSSGYMRNWGRDTFIAIRLVKKMKFNYKSN